MRTSRTITPRPLMTTVPSSSPALGFSPPRPMMTSAAAIIALLTIAPTCSLALGLSPPRATTTANRGPHTDPQLAASAEVGGAAFYVHIPYCRRRCHYCDFAIVPVGDVADDGGQRWGVDADADDAARGRGFEEMDRTYREAVLREIDLAARTAVARPGSGPTETAPPARRPRLRSVYLGGGTPSLAPTETLLLLLSAIRENFDLAPNAEVTIEMDPGTFDEAKLRTLASAGGVNRVSLGVQSFDDDVLRRIGRVHTRRDVFESVDMLQKVGIANFSIDLISGLPGVSLAQWTETLRTAGDLNPPHVSVYDLQVEPDTLFGRLYPDGQEDEDDDENSSVVFTPRGTGTASLSSARNVAATGASLTPLPSAADSAFMYKYTSGYLRARGYEHYEISSYAKSNNGGGSGGASSTNDDGSSENNRSRHNSIYWEPGADWFAAGLGATSSIRGKRFSRPRRMADYVRWVEEEVVASGRGSSENMPSAWVPPWIARPPNSTVGRGGVQDEGRSGGDDRDHGRGDEGEGEGGRTSRLADAVMTRLRTSDGLDLSWVRAEFGSDAVGHVLRGARLALDLDLASLSSPSRDGDGDGDGGGGGDDDDGREGGDADAAVGGGVLRLRDPDGFLFSNTIISSIFAELGVA